MGECNINFDAAELGKARGRRSGESVAALSHSRDALGTGAGARQGKAPHQLELQLARPTP